MNEVMTGDRYRVVVLFALAGAALGVLLAMFCCARGDDGYGKTDIGESVTLTTLTTVVGVLVGSALAHRSGPVGWAVSLGVMLLTGLLGAVMGWLVGDASERRWVTYEITRTSDGWAVAVGGLFGLVVGLLVLAPRWLRRPRN